MQDWEKELRKEKLPIIWIGWLFLAAVGIYIHFAYHLKFDDAILCIFIMAFLGVAWQENIMDDGTKAWKLILAFSLACFSYLNHESMIYTNALS